MAKIRCSLLLVASCLAARPALGQCQSIASVQKLSSTEGGLGPGIGEDDGLGRSLCALGDHDGDGVRDLAVGAPFGTVHGGNQGVLWILFMNADGTVGSKQKISDGVGGFGPLGSDDEFGYGVASLGDVDGDGAGDVAVGAPHTNEGGLDRGAVWILFLELDGSVKAYQKISGTSGGFSGATPNYYQFGWSLCSPGDLDGDGIAELVVGAPYHDGNFTPSRGAVWVLFLNADGTVRSDLEIGPGSGGFGGVLGGGDQFGYSVASAGDFDGDGIGDLAVGAHYDFDGGSFRGAVWLLLLDADGTVRSEQKISSTQGGFGGALSDFDRFGDSVCFTGDLDQDGIGDLAVGTPMDDDDATDQGAVWLLFLNADGTVRCEQKLSASNGTFGGLLDPFDQLGSALAPAGDLDGDGIPDLAVAAMGDDDGLPNSGAAWILFLGPDTFPPTLTCPDSVVVLDARGGTPGAFVSFAVTATDTCDPAPTVVCVPPSGSFFPRGTTMVTCTATDAAGNQDVGTFPVVVMPAVRPRRL